MEAYTAAGADGRDVDPAIAGENERVFLRRAKYVLRLAQSQPFSTGDRIDVPEWIGRGKFTYGSRVVITLLRGYKQTGEQQYLDAAHLAIGPQYGAHPLSMSFVTGLGERHPGNPTCEVCLADEVEAPYPGIPIFGVFAHLSNAHPFYKIANHDANNFPYIKYTSEDRPVLTRYIDHKQIIPQSEFTISTMSHTLVAIGLLAKRLNRLRVHNATLMMDDGSTYGSIALGLAQLYVLPTASCRWLFDDASLHLLGVGASCSSGEEGVGGGQGALRLRVQLGSGASVTPGATLTTRGPEVGYVNYETRQWEQTVVVTLPGDSGHARRLLANKEANAGEAGRGNAKANSLPAKRRRVQSAPESVAPDDDVANSFGVVAGTEQAYGDGMMITTNTSAPEPAVSPYGAIGFDALALHETKSSIGMQVDFSRGTAPDGGLFTCPGDCSGLGVCLADLGECVCLLGTAGDACEIGTPSTSVSPPSGGLHLEGEHARVAFGPGQECIIRYRRASDGAPYLGSTCELVFRQRD